MTITIGFATSNPHKLKETEQCFKHFLPHARILPLPLPGWVEETGQTFSENARIKLEAALTLPIEADIEYVIAEDAGLIIDALNGYANLFPFPGVYSDRWLTGDIQQTLFGKVFETLTYTEKNEAILRLMEGQNNRTAHYEAVLACWDRRSKSITTTSGTVALKVASTPQGKNGFGYDPIMIPAERYEDFTMAEISAAEKNAMSHRFQAIKQLVEHLMKDYSEPSL